jgi:hypothetical protein
MVANHQNVITEKDKQIAQYQKQVDSLQKVETELAKQIEEQRSKNNVSEFFNNKYPLHTVPRFNPAFPLFFVYVK